MMAGEFVALLAKHQAALMNERDEFFDPPYTTLQANVISGGTAVNVLAREARIVWEYRALPDRDPGRDRRRDHDRSRYRDSRPLSRGRR